MTAQLGLHYDYWLRKVPEADYRVARLAKDCGKSVTEVQRFTKRHFNTTPRELIRKIRMRKALALLESGESAKNVAPALRYKQLSHFSRDFKQFFGFPPRNVNKRRTAHAIAAKRQHSSAFG